MSKFRSHGDRLLVIDTPHPIRLLITLPFFIGGGYFLYYLIDTLHEYIGHANAGEWLGALPGMMLMLVMAALIIFPGLFLAASESLVVNRKHGVIGRRRELLWFHTAGKCVNIDGIERIVCRQTTKRHSDRKPGSTSGRTSSLTVYPVDLEMKNGDTAPLVEYSEKSVAKEVARTVAKFAELPLHDRL